MRLPIDFVSAMRPKYEGKAVCVTGGAGFIGGHLVDALMSLGATIRVVDDLSNATLEHLAELIDIEPTRLEFAHGSILDPSALLQAVEGCEIVFHLAAIGSVPVSMKEPRRVFAVNASGTVAVLEAARAVRARRVVLASSSSVYGGGSGPGPRRESESTSCLSPYAASKLAAETAVASWANAYGLEGVCLRYFNVFGPRQSPDSPYAAVIPAFTRRLLNSEPVTIYGDGRQTRDFTYVANVVAANLLAGVSENDLALRGTPMNIGTGEPIDLLTLARLLGERAGTGQAQPLAPELLPARAGDVRHSHADVSLATKLIGYKPFINLGDGLSETVAWARRALAGT